MLSTLSILPMSWKFESGSQVGHRNACNQPTARRAKEAPWLSFKLQSARRLHCSLPCAHGKVVTAFQWKRRFTNISARCWGERHGGMMVGAPIVDPNFILFTSLTVFWLSGMWKTCISFLMFGKKTVKSWCKNLMSWVWAIRTVWGDAAAAPAQPPATAIARGCSGYPQKPRALGLGRCKANGFQAFYVTIAQLVCIW